MSVYVPISFLVCSCEHGDKEIIRQTEGETDIPRGQVSGEMKLAGVLYGLVMLALPSHV